MSQTFHLAETLGWAQGRGPSTSTSRAIRVASSLPFETGVDLRAEHIGELGVAEVSGP